MMGRMNSWGQGYREVRRYCAGACLLLMCLGYSDAVLADWQFDKDKSRISFLTTKESFAQIKGGFHSFDGRIKGSPEDPLHTAANFIIQTSSISTGIGIRDSVLRGAAFFNVKAFPTMEFKSTKITKVDATHATVRGDLTMLGITKPLVFDVTLDKPTDTVTKAIKINATALATMNRYDWGMTTFVPAVGPEITVRVDAVLMNDGTDSEESPLR
ncbi:YceI family protein [Aquirhabdus sp.]|uniref:YceI family protein n=1 Tax=Aquirhabdus sp. TaxID=2824160 RepID=UPI00396C938C